jgi:hypothetical protein
MPRRKIVKETPLEARRELSEIEEQSKTSDPKDGEPDLARDRQPPGDASISKPRSHGVGQPKHHK